MVVLPLSGWLMMAKFLRRLISISGALKSLYDVSVVEEKMHVVVFVVLDDGKRLWLLCIENEEKESMCGRMQSSRKRMVKRSIIVIGLLLAWWIA